MKSFQFKHFIATFGAICLMVSLLVNISISKAAFGASPPWVRNDHMLPGTSFEQIVNLSRNDLDKDMIAKIEITGDEKLAKWVEIENEEGLIIKKGEKILPVKFIVNVPERVALREYKGNISASLKSIVDESSGQSGSVAIALGANIDLNIHVIGEKIIDYKVKSVRADQLQENKVYGFNLEIENLGNIDLNEIRGQVEIYDNSETEKLHTLDFMELRHTVEAYETLSQKVFFRGTTLPAGEYRVKIKVFKEDEVIYENTLYQKVVAEPVIQETEPKKPTMPEPVEEVNTEEELHKVMQVFMEDIQALRASAPVQNNETNTFLILGLVGIGFGITALICLVIVLIFVMRGRRSDNMRM